MVKLFSVVLDITIELKPGDSDCGFLRGINMCYHLKATQVHRHGPNGWPVYRLVGTEENLREYLEGTYGESRSFFGENAKEV